MTNIITTSVGNPIWLGTTNMEADLKFYLHTAGIGTYVVSKSLSHTSWRSRLGSWFEKAKDSAVGSSFDQHVVGGYRFLMRFYSPGDEIYIFGFSRGAYIARFLAEMLDYVGLLSHGNEEMVAFAWKAFSQWQCRRTTSEGDVEGMKKKAEMYEFMKGFRETFSRPVRRIQFLGLFDTVNSVPRFETAWMERSKFPYTAHSSAKVIRHAVSIDERRAKFRQDLMYQTRMSKKHHDVKKKVKHTVREKYRHRPKLSLVGKEGMAVEKEVRGRRPSYFDQLEVPGQGELGQPAPYRGHSRSKTRSKHGADDDGASTLSWTGPCDYGVDLESEDEAGQDVDEVWFAGGHGDVGGGWQVEPGTKSTSHVPLVWVVREAMKAGLRFDLEKVAALGCGDVLDCEPVSQDQHTPVPHVRVDPSSPPTSPVLDAEPREIPPSNGSSHTATDYESRQNPFQELMHKAHVARTHDSLSLDCGMSYTSVLAWKMMEYIPFRRMDLQPDGTWKPIRWPLPGGEVRDIPDDAKVHGSVIRRMRADKKYRPGNLIVGGGGRGCRIAPEEYGIGQWECIANPGCPVGEVWRKVPREDSDAS